MKEVVKQLGQPNHAGAMNSLENIEATSDLVVRLLIDLYQAMKPRR